MNEHFYMQPGGNYYAIRWGALLICSIWLNEDGARALCDLLEATRQMSAAGDDAGAFLVATRAHEAAWQRFQELCHPGEA